MSQSEVEELEIDVPDFVKRQEERQRSRSTAMRYALQFHSGDQKFNPYDLTLTAEQIHKFLNQPDDVPVAKPTVADDESF